MTAHYTCHDAARSGREVVTLVGTTDDALPCGCIPYEHREYGPCPALVSPDCDQRKCTACTGDACDLTGDRPAHCTCTCHDTCGCIPYDPCTTPLPWRAP